MRSQSHFIRTCHVCLYGRLEYNPLVHMLRKVAVVQPHREEHIQRAFYKSQVCELGHPTRHPIAKKKCTGAVASMIFDGTFRLMLSLSTLSDMMHAQILKKQVTLKLRHCFENIPQTSPPHPHPGSLLSP